MDQIPENQSSPSSVGWALAAVVFAIFMLASTESHAGFFAKFFAFLLGSFLGWLGAVIGDAIRRFALPDSFFTSGGMESIITTKLFWMFGPQLVGLVLGTALGIGLVLY